MKKPIPNNENDRLKALKRYNVLDTLSEEEYDNITKLASYICNVPIALISLIDEKRQWFKSKIGLGVDETAREISFCQHAIMTNNIFEVQNTLEDDEFKNNPLVTGDPNIRFYAGAPLTTPDGFNIGTLCVIDTKINELTSDQKNALKILAKQVITLLELRIKNNELIEASGLQNSILDGTNYSIIYTDTSGLIKKINSTALKMLEYEESEVLNILTPAAFHDINEVIERSKTLSTELNIDVKPGFTTFIEKARLTNKGDSNEWTYITKSGKRIPVWLTVTCIRDQNGTILGYLGIAEDYSLKKELDNELLNAKTLAEQAVKTKDNFLANMSHEIRTPMNAMIGFTDLLLQSNPTSEQKEYINSVKEAGDNLLVIINDILDLSKIESGKLVIDKYPFDIEKALKHVYNLLKFKAEEKGLKFTLNFDENIPKYILGDKGRLNQILMNLAGNAIKFTHQGEVTISTQVTEINEESVTLKFMISDTGIGISEDQIQSIFDRFSQGEESTSRKFGGTGLGLSICQQLVEIQESKLYVRSKINEGSEFYFSLTFLIQDQLEKPETSEAIETDFSNTKVKILLCEDNFMNQRLAEIVVKNFGFEIDITENGQEGIELLKKKHYDLILMDLQMPILDGYQATKFIRNEMNSSIPIIAMTAHSMISEEEKCLELGMDAYVPKPFTKEELLRKINYVLEIDKKNDPEKVQNIQKENKEHAEFKVDLSYLKKVSQGNQHFEKEMIQLFIDKIPIDLEILETAIENKIYKEIKGYAHKIKSSLTFLKLDLIREKFIILENKGNNEVDLGQDDLEDFQHSKNEIYDTISILKKILLSDYKEF